MLGTAVAALLESRGYPVTVTDLPEFDITRTSDIRLWMAQARPLAVINCAAMTAVDAAETDQDLALAVNRDGVANLAQAAAAVGIPLLHVSTDYVFNGTKAGPWTEEDGVDPVNFYGRSKLEGERPVLDYEHGTVVRTSWLFGPKGPNFVKTIATKLRTGEMLEVVDDQRGCPTSTAALARALVTLLEAGRPGLYHFCQPPAVTWFGFARAIADSLGVPAERVSSTTSDRFPRPAKRPANSVLATAKYEKVAGAPVPSWQGDLMAYLAGEL
jgi:dTDP-4-dehydrorhamnose reductase